MINAVFYARFHIEKGPLVLHSWPPGAVISDPQGLLTPIFDFSEISEFIIPRQDLCQQPLSICSNGHRILGHPMCLENAEKYARNEFIFNFCIVVPETEEYSAYEKVAIRVAHVLADAEEQENFLLEDETSWEHVANAEGDDQRMHVPILRMLCENMFEDLNNYGECIIQLTSAHELNLKLFPIVPPALPAKAFQVPYMVVDLGNAVDSLWDMTMQRIMPYINGVNHVARISELAQTDLSLVQQAVRQFVRFGLVVLIDIFQYGATYAPTPYLGRLLFDTAIQEDCARFAASTSADMVSTDLIVDLYARLSHSVTLKSWALENRSALESINVRRFIVVGLVKGLIYRVHRYAVKDSSVQSGVAMSSQDRQLDRYLDGTHCFDEVCVALSIAPDELMARLKSRQGVHVFER